MERAVRLMAWAFFALALVIAAVAPCATHDDFGYELGLFHDRWTEFVAEYSGCGDVQLPLDRLTVIECRPALGRLDQRKLRRAREAAKRFFDL